MAARPQTLPVGVSPVVVGVGLAFHNEVFEPFPAFAALVGALLIQIGTNFANDYFDAVKGTDTDEREGFTRVTQSGLIQPGEVKRAMYLTFAVAILTGVYLVYIGGLPILIIGLSSVAAGLLYTGGPYPYGYRGLGDLFVFVFFGLVAVTGTYYVQAVAVMAQPLSIGIPSGTITGMVVAASLPAAGLATAVLVVNNIRDRETDAKTGKRTLAVLIGYRWSRIEFLLLVGLAYAVPCAFAIVGYGLSVLLPLLTLPFAVSLARTVLTETSGAALNPALETTGKLLAAHSVLFAIGLALANTLP
jgi:1,4-dihydroxy-2-naphthoate octaprenyltransferase